MMHVGMGVRPSFNMIIGPKTYNSWKRPPCKLQMTEMLQELWLWRARALIWPYTCVPVRSTQILVLLVMNVAAFIVV
jgi:hypothetical protein